MSEKYIVAQPAVSETCPDLADLATQFLMRLRKLLAQGDYTVAVTGSHGWRPFDPAPPCLTQSVTGTRCCRHPITRRGGTASTAAFAIPGNHSVQRSQSSSALP